MISVPCGTGDICLRQICISNVMLYRWIVEYKTYGDASFVGKGHLKPEEAKLKNCKKKTRN